MKLVNCIYAIFDAVEKAFQGSGYSIRVSSVSLSKFPSCQPFSRTGFCGADFTEKHSKIIRKEDTTLKAFKIMINFVYKKPISFEEMTIEELFNVVDLGHYYELSELEELMKQQLAAFKVTKDTVLEVATVAEQFKKFEDASTALFDNCAKMLNKELGNDFESLLSFCSQLSAGEEAKAVVGLKLLSAVKKLRALAGQTEEVLEKERKRGEVKMKFEEIRDEVDAIAEGHMTRALTSEALSRLTGICESLEKEALGLIKDQSYTEEFSIWCSVRALKKRINDDHVACFM